MTTYHMHICTCTLRCSGKDLAWSARGPRFKKFVYNYNYINYFPLYSGRSLGVAFPGTYIPYSQKIWQGIQFGGTNKLKSANISYLHIYVW